MGLKQYEERRGTVLAGRALHQKHEKENRSYVPAGLSGKKLIGLHLYSGKLGLSGKIDEVIDADEEIILVERKYSDYVIIGDTLKTQIGLLALLLEENLGKPVRRARVIFAKEDWKMSEVLLDESIRNFALRMLQEVKEVIKSGTDPPESPDRRCHDCCFRKVCSVGSLYTGK